MSFVRSSVQWLSVRRPWALLFCLVLAVTLGAPPSLNAAASLSAQSKTRAGAAPKATAKTAAKTAAKASAPAAVRSTHKTRPDTKTAAKAGPARSDRRDAERLRQRIAEEHRREAAQRERAERKRQQAAEQRREAARQAAAERKRERLAEQRREAARQAAAERKRERLAEQRREAARQRAAEEKRERLAEQRREAARRAAAEQKRQQAAERRRREALERERERAQVIAQKQEEGRQGRARLRDREDRETAFAAQNSYAPDSYDLPRYEAPRSTYRLRERTVIPESDDSGYTPPGAARRPAREPAYSDYTPPASGTVDAGALDQQLELTARSYIVMDADSGRVIVSKNPDTPRQPASTIKIVTGLIALNSLDNYDRVPVSRHAASMPRSKVDIRPSQPYSADDMINSVLLASANDASVALAERIAGSESRFAQLMTYSARRWGARNTVCRTASGLTADGQQSTARDLAQMFRYAMRNREFVRRMHQRTMGTNFGKTLKNHNKALWNLDGAIAGKTGFTKAAGQTYVGQFRRGKRSIVVAIMGSGTMWRDLERLVNYGFGQTGGYARR